jgi:WD40 repeat protein
VDLENGKALNTEKISATKDL